MKDIRCDLCGKAVESVFTLRKNVAIPEVKDLCYPCEERLSKYRDRVGARLEKFREQFVRKHLVKLYQQWRRG